MKRLTLLVADITPRLRVTLELLPAPVDTVGVEIPRPAPVPREYRDTVRPPAACRVIPMQIRKGAA